MSTGWDVSSSPVGCPGCPSLRRVALTAGGHTPSKSFACPDSSGGHACIGAYCVRSSCFRCQRVAEGEWCRAQASRVPVSVRSSSVSESEVKSGGRQRALSKVVLCSRRSTGSEAGMSVFPDRPSSLAWLFAVRCRTAYATVSLKSILPVRIFCPHMASGHWYRSASKAATFQS